MTPDRYNEVAWNDGELTREEWDKGWHFCCEFDGLLVGPEMIEMECCSCLKSPGGEDQDG